ncbi:ABC transporter substrate-binding protein [Kordiimonas sp. SCSIO 12610]|uniref:ABC transporter substrate-binding protein n=1 Tax=Kordiimonas sp. SCSIO 12610 TaxID=2829597 RepID=UPI00210C4C31|nr:ABC transporter substrate-binding protein [Kordiimonas sp. SCSIO 12610]UTW54984.1 ABC transporter substrate-binding protein [Kordiimonas sp. SCSIO 12610]
MIKLMKFYLQVMISVLCVFTINSCAPKHPDPPITVAANLWPGYDTFFMAETLNMYPENSVHMVETPRSLALAQAIRGASIDAAAMSLSRAIEISEKEVDVSIVLVLDSSEGADAILAKPEYKSIKDLKGKRVAAEMDSITGYMFLRALEINGMSLDDVIMNSIDNRIMAELYEAEELDAVGIYGYDRAKVAELGAVKLFDSSEISGEIIDVLVVRNKYIEQYPNRVVDLIVGWIKTLNYINSLKSSDDLPIGAMNREDYVAAKNGVKIWSPTDNINAFENNHSSIQSIIDINIQHGIDLGFVREGVKPPSIRGDFLTTALKRLGSD